MALFRFSCWTGPTCVKEIARMMTETGEITDIVEGTEHVYGTIEGMDRGGAGWNVLAALERKHGTSAGLRPSVVKQVEAK